MKWVGVGWAGNEKVRQENSKMFRKSIKFMLITVEALKKSYLNHFNPPHLPSSSRHLNWNEFINFHFTFLPLIISSQPEESFWYVKMEKLLFLRIIVLFAAVNVWKWWPDELVDGVRRSGLSLMRCSTEGGFFGREENDNADFLDEREGIFSLISPPRCSRHSKVCSSEATEHEKKRRSKKV